MRQSLPIQDVLEPIHQGLASHGVVVLHAPTGAGKTTRVPLSLMERRPDASQQIVVLEPRRLAARLAAAKTTGEKSALVDLLSAVGGADALAPVLPHIGDADPDLRARASSAALKVVLTNGPPSGPVAEELQTEVTAALEAPDAEGGVLLLGALAPGAEEALEAHLSGTRLVKAQPQEPTAPAALAARLALSALGDDEARTSLLKSRSRSRKPKAEIAPEAEPAPEALAAAEGEAPKVSRAAARGLHVLVQKLPPLRRGPFKDRDLYGAFITCMQCGFSRDMPSDHRGPLVITAEPVPVPVAPPPDGDKRRSIPHGGRHFSKTFAYDAEAMTETAASPPFPSAGAAGKGGRS